MVRGCLPWPVQQSDRAQLLQCDATPVVRRSGRPQATFALAAVLITEDSQLALAVSAKPVRAKQAPALVIAGRNRPSLLNRPVYLRIDRPRPIRAP